ncbi:PH domain-containing protein [Chloroflexota bacterium]
MEDKKKNTSYGGSTLNKAILTEGEQIIFETRPLIWPHIFTTLVWFVIGLIITILPFSGLLAGVPDWILLEAIAWFGGSIMLISAIVMIVRILEWRYTAFALTDKRVLRQKGIVARSYVDCTLNRIQNMYVDISMMGRLLGYGTVRIAAAGTAGIEIRWEGVRDPLGVQRQINEAIEDYSNIDKQSTGNGV